MDDGGGAGVSVAWDYVRAKLEWEIRSCRCFCTTFDMWTSAAGMHYLNDNFVLISAPMDLIPFQCSSYGWQSPRGFWSTAMRPLSPTLPAPQDGEPCFNHCLKHVIDDVTDSDKATHKESALDFKAMGLAISVIRGSSILRKVLLKPSNPTTWRIWSSLLPI